MVALRDGCLSCVCVPYGSETVQVPTRVNREEDIDGDCQDITGTKQLLFPEMFSIVCKL